MGTNLYNPRFNYTELTREQVDGKRLYATPDGKRVPSVTTILDRTKSEEKKQILENWRRRVGHAQAQAITTDAANRGTRMHKYLEDYIKDGELAERGSNPYSWASHAMAQKIISDGLSNVNEVWGVEVPLYFPGIYAGTADGTGVHRDGQAMLDYKQTNKPKKREWIEDYFLQLAAYAEAHDAVHGTSIDKGVILMAVKPDLNEQFEIIKPPEYLEFVVEGEEFKHYKREWWKRVEAFYLLNS
jgi:genome maintenance exonuclease 1